MKNRDQYKIWRRQAGGGHISYKILTSQVEEGNIPNTISYVEVFMTTMKMKNNFYNGYQYEIQKSRDGWGNNAYKVLTSCVEEGHIPKTMSYGNYSWLPWKKKNSFCDGHQYEMRKSWDGGGNNACEVIVCWVEERNIINKQNILFVVVCSYNEKETTFSMKPKSQGRRWDSVKKKCKNFNWKEVSFNNKRSSPNVLKGSRKIKHQ